MEQPIHNCITVSAGQPVLRGAAGVGTTQMPGQVRGSPGHPCAVRSLRGHEVGQVWKHVVLLAFRTAIPYPWCGYASPFPCVPCVWEQEGRWLGVGEGVDQ